MVFSLILSFSAIITNAVIVNRIFDIGCGDRKYLETFFFFLVWINIWKCCCGKIKVKPINEVLRILGTGSTDHEVVCRRAHR